MQFFPENEEEIIFTQDPLYPEEFTMQIDQQLQKNIKQSLDFVYLNFQQLKINYANLEMQAKELVNEAAKRQRRNFEIAEEIKSQIQEKTGFQKQNIHVCGSNVFGLVTKHSDIDLTLLIEKLENEEQYYLKQVSEALRKLYQVEEIFQTPVPLIQFQYRNKWNQQDTEISIQLTINNIYGIYNSQLFNVYCMSNSEFQKAAIVLK